VKLLGWNHFLTSTMTRVTEPARADVEVREPRCRICRDETVRVVVNELLDLRGAPAIVVGGNRGRWITYTDILGMLEPLNEGRDNGDRITYDSLWIHAKRHYDLDGIAAYWESQMVKDLRHALMRGGRKPIEQQKARRAKYDKIYRAS
jgi:hypothetical protein